MSKVSLFQSYSRSERVAGTVCLVIGSIFLIVCASLCVYIYKAITKPTTPQTQAGVVHVSSIKAIFKV